MHKIFDGDCISCEIAQYRKSLISVFQEFFASIGEILISGGGLRGTKLLSNL